MHENKTQGAKMNIANMLNSISFRRRSPNRRAFQRSNAQAYQTLEQRQLLATFTVTTLLDSADGQQDGEISLREAIVAADTNAAFGDAPAGSPSGDTIRFDAALNGQAIMLDHGELTISERLNIVGGVTRVAVNADQDSRVFNIDSSQEVRLSGITIRAGSVDGGGINITGGGLLRLSQVVFADHGNGIFSGITGAGIYNQGSEIISVGSRFSRNNAARGAAIYSEGGRLYLRSNTFESNSADERGGAVFIKGGNHFIDSGTFSDNFAADPFLFSGGSGGAIHAEDAAVLTVRDATFSGNRSGFGGAIFAGADTRLRVSSAFIDNRAFGFGSPNGTSGPSGTGGGISSFGDIVVFGGSFEGNRSYEKGGAIYSTLGTAVVSNAVFLGNGADVSGGGIAVEDGAMKIFNATVGGNGEGEGNLALTRSSFQGPFGFGGGIALMGTANVTVVGGSVVNNQSLVNGGGISVSEESQIQILGDTEIAHNVIGFQNNIEPRTSLGGGIYSAGILKIDNAAIENNRSDASGGGLYIAGGYTRINNSTISGNRANVSGGGLAIAGGVALVKNTDVGGTDMASGNFAGVPGSDDPNGTGGGISVSGDTIRFRVDGGVIAHNVATLAGGGIHASAGRVSFVNGVQVTNNSARKTDGGGVFSDGATTLAVLDAVFSENSARDGAGVYNNRTRMYLAGTTVVANEARRNGGGIFFGTESNVNIGDSEVFGNSALQGDDVFQDA